MDTTKPQLASIGIDIGKEVFHIVGFVRIPIKATAREPIKQDGYISATSATHAQSLLRNAAGPYIWVKTGNTHGE